MQKNVRKQKTLKRCWLGRTVAAPTFELPVKTTITGLVGSSPSPVRIGFAMSRSLRVESWETKLEPNIRIPAVSDCGGRCRHDGYVIVSNLEEHG